MIDAWLWTSLIAYLVGSIPFGIVAARIVSGPDPRTVGSGNIGFTNVLRTSGKKAGLLTLAGDFGKGFGVALLVNALELQEPQALVVLFAVIIGHVFPVFLKFHGGKGVATALGASMGYDFSVGIVVLGIWGVAVFLWRYSSGGAVAAFASLPLVGMAMGRSIEFLVFASLVSALILWRHRANIQRMIEGTENKIGAQKLPS